MRDGSLLLAIGGMVALLLYALRRRAGPEPEPLPPDFVRLPPVLTSVQARVMEHRGIIMAEAKLQGVDPAIICAIIDVESSGNPNATNYEANVDDYSYGLMQVRWTTAQWLCQSLGIRVSGRCPTREDMLKPGVNIRYGAAYFKYQFVRYTGYPDKAIAAYNAGTANYNIWGNFTNQDYVDRVMRRIEPYRKILAWYYPGRV